MSFTGTPRTERTPWRMRLIFNTRRKPFPYLFHSWQITNDLGYITSGSIRHVRAWMRDYYRGELT